MLCGEAHEEYKYDIKKRGASKEEERATTHDRFTFCRCRTYSPNRPMVSFKANDKVRRVLAKF